VGGLSKTPRASAFPPSPCIGICKLDENEVCTGCKRTIAEIAEWPEMTAEEQWRVVNALPQRKTGNA
jgi:hypothetical protein